MTNRSDLIERHEEMNAAYESLKKRTQKELIIDVGSMIINLQQQLDALKELITNKE